MIRYICNRYDVLLIVDEVMTAWGRLGSWFAMDHYGVTPDIVATSKGLTAGYTPIAATIAREEIWQTLENAGTPFMAGHTLSENPPACAAAVATLNYTEEHNILANSRDTGAYLLERLRGAARLRYRRRRARSWFHVRHRAGERQSHQRAFPASQKSCMLVMLEGIQRGLILFPCTGNIEGVMGDMLLVTPPLITTREQVDEIVEITKEALASCAETASGVSWIWRFAGLSFKH